MRSNPRKGWVIFQRTWWVIFQRVLTETPVCPPVSKNFTGIDDVFDAPNHTPYLHLYLNSDVTLNFEQVEIPEVTIMIKQCYNASKALIWPDNILWQNKALHQMTQTPNATDIVKLCRLPETTHFLGTVVAQNFQFQTK